jgi:hypothetical protein
MTEIIGPFHPKHLVGQDGCIVPHLTVRPQDDGTIEVSIDGRFTMRRSVTQEEFDCWVPLLANAMAVAAGYTCHGEGSKPINPFAHKYHHFIPSPADLTIVGGLDAE